MSKVTFTDYVLNNSRYIESRDKLNNLIKSMHSDNKFIGTERQQKEYRELTEIFNSVVIDLLEDYCQRYN